jgi:hypothetical protein
MRSVVGLVVVLVASQGWAQSVFKWTDAEGTTHYTNDPASIPKDAKVTATTGAEVNVITAEGEADPPLPPAVPKAATAKAAAANTDPEVPSASELEWRRLFREANLKIRELQDQIEADKNVVEQINGMPITGHLRCGYGYITPAPIVGANSGVSITANGQVLPNAVVGPNTYGAYAGTPCWYGADPKFEHIRQRLAKNRIALERAKEDLADLERQASFASVPREWRR